MQTAPKLLVFDLDGTLIDSTQDLCNSINATLKHYHQDELPQATIASFIGDGVEVLISRALSHQQTTPAKDALAEAVDWFIAYYNVHKLDYTRTYKGVMESLAAIRQRNPNLPMAVLTNKPVDPSRAICKSLGLSQYMFAIYGGNSFPTKKPHPEGLQRLIAEVNVQPEQTVMIGDSHVDIETARAAGTQSLGCNFGLSPESLAAANPDHTVDRASEWPEALGL